jgi:hypothetical protein
MVKKYFFLVVALLMGNMTVTHAKINYVPLYIVDTTPDVKGVKHAPSIPLFITQDDHRLTLPEIDDSLTFRVFKDNDCVYEVTYDKSQPTLDLPAMLVGDYEVRLSADTYYCYGYLTLEFINNLDIPTEYGNWENITPLGSNTSQESILNSFMGLSVVEYNRKDEKNGQRYVGLFFNELKAAFPQVTDDYYGVVIDDINIWGLFSVLTSCIQELKAELDSRTEKIVDVMMSRGTSPSAVSEVRAAIGNTLLSAAPTSDYESARVRYLLTDNVTNAYIAVTDMEGRQITRVPVSPSETSVSIDSGTLGQGVFLCTLFVNGENVGTKRLVKTR